MKGEYASMEFQGAKDKISPNLKVSVFI